MHGHTFHVVVCTIVHASVVGLYVPHWARKRAVRVDVTFVDVAQPVVQVWDSPHQSSCASTCAQNIEILSHKQHWQKAKRHHETDELLSIPIPSIRRCQSQSLDVSLKVWV